MRSAAAIATQDTPPPARGTRLQNLAPGSYNAQAHTVEAVLSTGTRVNRLFLAEELEISATAIDLARAASGRVPLLNSHNAYDIDAVLGTVSNVRVASGKLLGVLAFGQTDAAIRAESMVERGELTSVSIGYSVREWTLVQQGDADNPAVWRATSWELLEVSLVSVPADPAAGVRSAASVPAELSERGDDMLTRSDPVHPANPPPATAAQAAIEILDQGRRFAVEDQARALIERYSRGEITVDAMRSELLRAAADRQAADTSRVPAGSAAVVTEDERDRRMAAMSNALEHRMRPATKLTDAGRNFRGMSMIDMVRFDMRQRGVRDVDFISPDEIVTRMHSTSDFPTLLTGTGNRVLLATFAAAPNVLKSLARQASIDDFRKKTSVKGGAFQVLEETLEGGEIKHGSTSESYENYQLKTYAKIFSLSRQAIINDDLGAFSDWMTRMATAAAETEAGLLVNLLTANSGLGPTLTDNVTLFHAATHLNYTSSGTAISTVSLGVARQTMRSQKGLDGKTPAPVVPKTLLVSAAKESEGEAALAAIYAATPATANLFAGKLDLAVEPRLSGNGWYVFGDPNLSPVLEYAYLSGAEGPQLSSKEGWDVLGMQFRCVLDFGCGVVDWRGAYKNAGA